MRLLVAAVACLHAVAVEVALFDCESRAAVLVPAFDVGPAEALATLLPDLSAAAGGLWPPNMISAETAVSEAKVRALVGALPLPLPTTPARERALDLTARALTGEALGTRAVLMDSSGATRPATAYEMYAGTVWPEIGFTMVGEAALVQLRHAVETVILEGIPGDIIECGVWRGGASIFAMALLDDAGDTARRVWLLDSFDGLPRASHFADGGDFWSEMAYLRVSQPEVEANVRSFLGPSSPAAARAVYRKGYFNESAAAVEATFSILRLNGDMFTSYLDCLFALYPKLSPGGYVICDDCTIGEAMSAVLTFRALHGIDQHPDEGLETLGLRLHWRKRREVAMHSELWPPGDRDLPFVIGSRGHVEH